MKKTRRGQGVAGYLRWAIGALALAGAGCHHAEHEVEAPERLQVTSPLRQSTELHRDYVAQIKAIRHIELRALERGYLQTSFVDEGQRVQSGQRMFQLMPMLVQAEVQKAEAEADRTEIELQNAALLAGKNIVSANELALAKANRARAQAELNLAQAHRGLTELKAPFTGIMGRFHARPGSLIDEGDLLTTLSDTSTVWVYFNVAESEYLKLKTEDPEAMTRPVKLLMANGKLFDQPGRVETTDADFDTETGTIAFRAAFPNPTGLLRHGETGKVVMSVPVADALVLPQKATFEVLEKKYVFVVDEHHAVHARPITVSAELPQLYVVSGGLTEKDQVLIEGLRKVHEGSVIEPSFTAPQQVLAHLDVAAE